MPSYPRHALSLALSFALAAAAHADDAGRLDRIEVSATTTRMPEGKSALPATITVITREDLEQQLAVTTDLSDILGNLVPAFSPSRQKLSSAGETLRGREPLYMIDGVPQSNPLRNGARDGYTIDPAMIERIEIVHGANALQGLGASGGIIHIITKRAPADGSALNELTLGASAPTDYESDGLGWRGSFLHGRDFGVLDLVAGISAQSRGLFYDGAGRAIGVDTTQGDLMDSESLDVFAKVGAEFDAAQRLQLSVNRFHIEGNGDYRTVPGDMAAGVPTGSVRGDVEGLPPENRVLTATLDYQHANLAGGELVAQVFRQEFRALYGGGRFATFQDPALGDDIFDQSRNRSDKTGTKLTWGRSGLLDGNLTLGMGLDFLRDTTFQELALTGRKWVPETTYVGWAPFVQAEYWVGDALSLNGGLRQERGKLEVDTFTTLAFYGPVTVDGGEPEFTETLPNVGATWFASEAVNLFASYAEGYTMPDVGRVLRGIDEPGLDVDSFLNLAPVIADNREVGLEYAAGSLDARVSYFTSEADSGARLQFDAANQVYNVVRERTEIEGVEARIGWAPTDDTQLSLGYAAINGRSDRDRDGRVDSDLDGANISPDRVNLGWTQAFGDAWSTRVQVNHFLDRDFERQGQPAGAFDGYTTADAFVRFDAGRAGLWTLGLENLADKDYISYNSQTVGDDESYFAGRGRVLSLTWQARF